MCEEHDAGLEVAESGIGSEQIQQETLRAIMVGAYQPPQVVGQSSPDFQLFLPIEMCL